MMDDTAFDERTVVLDDDRLSSQRRPLSLPLHENVDASNNQGESMKGAVDPLAQETDVNFQVLVEEKPSVEDEEPILPDHYYDGGNIPIFKPVFPC